MALYAADLATTLIATRLLVIAVLLIAAGRELLLLPSRLIATGVAVLARGVVALTVVVEVSRIDRIRRDGNDRSSGGLRL